MATDVSFTQTEWNEGAAPGISAAELDRIEQGIDDVVTQFNLHNGGTATTDHPEATGSVRGLMSAADKTKLNGIETAATADQTAAEILTAIKTVDGAGSGLDADLLDNLQASAFVQTPVVAGDIQDNAVTHSKWQQLTVRAESTSRQNIGTGITPLSVALNMPSAGLVVLHWGIQVERTADGSSGNTMNILPRDDGVNISTYYRPSDVLLDGVLPATGDATWFSGTGAKSFAGADNSTWSLFVSKTGPNTFDFVHGYLLVVAHPT